MVYVSYFLPKPRVLRAEETDVRRGAFLRGVKISLMFLKMRGRSVLEDFKRGACGVVANINMHDASRAGPPS
jgi:hypothetical protein